MGGESGEYGLATVHWWIRDADAESFRAPLPSVGGEPEVWGSAGTGVGASGIDTALDGSAMSRNVVRRRRIG